MNSNIPPTIADKENIQQWLEKLSQSLIQDYKQAMAQQEFALIGIHSRGVPLAQRLVQLLQQQTGYKVNLGALGITLYRDDLGQSPTARLIKPTEIEFSLDNKIIVLVDDVLFTGRTIRSALNEIMDYGRAQLCRLAVLVDRDGRQLPIQADYIGQKIKTDPKDKILVRLQETDPEVGDAIYLA